MGAFHFTISSGAMSHGGSKNLKRGKTMYQPHRHLSQLHTTNYMALMREKGAFWKKNFEPIGDSCAHRPL